MFTQSQKHAGLLMVFAVSALINLSFLILVPDSLRQEEFTDYKSFYEPVARNIANGHGITHNGDVATFQGPGLPVILGVLFLLAEHTFASEEFLLSLAIFACSGLTATFVYLMASQIWNSKLAFLSALIWMIYPLNLWFLQHLSSELPFMVAMYLGLFLLWKMHEDRPSFSLGFFCGVVFGIAALIRPVGIGLPMLATAILWFSARKEDIASREKIALSSIIGAVLVVSPWIMWASYQRGEFVLIASSGVGTVMDGLTYAVDDNFPEGAVSSDVAAMQNRLLEEKPRSIGEITSLVLKEFQNNPMVAIEMFLVKFSRNWYGTYSGRRELIALMMHLPFFTLALIGSLGAWRRHENRWQIFTNWLFLLYFLLMSTSVNTNVRYIAPALGIVLIFSPGVFGSLKRTASPRTAGPESIS